MLFSGDGSTNTLKGCDGENKWGKEGKGNENSSHYVFASSRLPNADSWNAAHSCQLNKSTKN